MSTDRVSATTDGVGGSRALPMRARVALFVVALAAVTLSACQKDASPDPFIGPSELALSIALSASPDVLPLDGASQSVVFILARDASGQAVANVTLRLQISFGGVLQDIGQLSARTLVTGQDGRAVVTYTAPLAVSGVDSGAQVEILVTPVGDNYASAVPRTLAIRLVPSGVVIPPQTVSAGFRFTPSSPAEFQEILFETTCLSGGDTNCTRGAVTYAWDFGDGTTGTGATVTHAYASPSTHTVTLTVADAFARTATAARSVTVVTGGTPTASFTVSPVSPNLGDTVFFNASASTAPSGRSIVSYDWTFGDGGAATGTTVSHVFGVAATYSVTLTVTDDRGATGSTTSMVVVTTSLPIASFVFSPTAPSTSTPVFFDASASRATVAGRTLVSYDWVFGDGSTGTGVRVDHGFDFASTFRVTLTVTDSVGEKATTTASVAVGSTGGAPTASFTVSPSPSTVGLNTTVDASASRPSPGATIERYDWDFGETGARFQCPGDSSCGDQNRTFVYRYTRAGSYTINLTIRDSTGQTATTTQTIAVGDVADPIALFTASPNSVAAPATINFNASASSASTGRTIVSYAWDFGDGSPAGAGETPSHMFMDAGTYTVTLTVTDSAGDTGQVTVIVTLT